MLPQAGAYTFLFMAAGTCDRVIYSGCWMSLTWEDRPRSDDSSPDFAAISAVGDIPSQNQTCLSDSKGLACPKFAPTAVYLPTCPRALGSACATLSQLLHPPLTCIEGESGLPCHPPIHERRGDGERAF